jgi:dTDP-4-amino-4,6-dideoxygalactose transaminase
MRQTFLAFSPPAIGPEEIAEVIDTLRSDWITTGPKTRRFEAAFAERAGAPHAVAVNSCTAAMHLALAAWGLGPGDEVITTPYTFCSTVNVILHAGARPVLADVCPDDLTIDPAAVEAALTPRTRAILPVHFAGQPCRMDDLLAIAARHGLRVLEDAAHAVGATYRGRPIGALGDATAFSFYATKNLTTAEGGMLTTADAALAERVRRLSNHGMSRDAWKRYSAEGSWYYEVVEAGFKYNMTDLQASLGLHQLAKQPAFQAWRAAVVAAYQAGLGDLAALQLSSARPEVGHAWHLYSHPAAAGCAADRAGAGHRGAEAAQHRRERPLHPAQPAPLLPRAPGLGAGPVPGRRGRLCRGRLAAAPPAAERRRRGRRRRRAARGGHHLRCLRWSAPERRTGPSRSTLPPSAGWTWPLPCWRWRCSGRCCWRWRCGCGSIRPARRSTGPCASAATASRSPC